MCIINFILLYKSAAWYKVVAGLLQKWGVQFSDCVVIKACSGDSLNSAFHIHYTCIV